MESQVAGRTFRLEIGMCVGGLQSVIQKHFEQHQNKHRVPLNYSCSTWQWQALGPKEILHVGSLAICDPQLWHDLAIWTSFHQVIFQKPLESSPGSAWEEARCYGACQGDEVSCLQHLVVGRCLERGANAFGSVFYNYTCSCLFWS